MAENRDTRGQVELETGRRARLGVPVTASGVVYLLGAIIVYQALTGRPTVGLVQALQPALGGQAGAQVSPRAAEVSYLSHHAFGLIAGSVLESIAIAFLTLLLLLLLDAVRFRQQGGPRTVDTVVRWGGAAVVVLGVAGPIAEAIKAQDFASGHVFSTHAIEKIVTDSAPIVIIGTLNFFALVALVVGMIMCLLRAARVGLIPLWLRTFGITAAVFMLPLFSAYYPLAIILTGWMVAMGMMFLGRLPSGIPPAWESGEAIPWPAPAGRGRGAGRLQPEAALQAGEEDNGSSGANGLATAAPGAAAGGRRRRRRRGARG